MKLFILYECTDKPYGGANQFLKALRNWFKAQGYYADEVEVADVILINSHVYSDTMTISEKLSTYGTALADKVFVQRIDGPVSLYRGEETDRVDQFIFNINEHIADATIYQSQWSRIMCHQMGLATKPLETIIHNAPDPSVFYTHNSTRTRDDEQMHIIATSWSMNSNKGFDIYEYLDHHLDTSRYAMTFVGRSPYTFKHINHIQPVCSSALASLLRQHHIYLSASRFEACSNALLEGMHCGCVPVARNTSSMPEIVGDSGVLFADTSDVLAAIDQAGNAYDRFAHKLRAIPSFTDVAERYYAFCAEVFARSTEDVLR